MVPYGINGLVLIKGEQLPMVVKEIFELVQGSDVIFPSLGNLGGAQDILILLGLVQPTLDGTQQFVFLKGFGQVVISTQIHSLSNLEAFGLGGNEDKGNMPRRIVQGQFLKNAVSVQFGHHDVTEYQVRQLAQGQFHPNSSIG